MITRYYYRIQNNSRPPANFRFLTIYWASVLQHKRMLTCSWQLMKTTNTCFSNLWPILLYHNTMITKDWPSNFQNGLILCKVFGHLSMNFPQLILNSAIMYRSVNLLAQRDLEELKGPASFYDRWLKWQSQSNTQAVHHQIADELVKTLQAEPVK